MGSPSSAMPVEPLRALAHHHRDVRNRRLVDQMFVMLRQPVEVLAPGLLPAAVRTQALFAADEVIPRNHAAGDGLVHPHLRFLSGLMDVAPARLARRV